MTALWGIATWIVLGLIAGFVASKVVDKHGQGMALDIVLGIAGALLGGWLFNLTGHHGITGFNLYSLIVATAGAVLILIVYHAIQGMAKK